MTQQSSKAYSLFEVKALDDEKREIRGMASTPTPDRVGDIVDPMGMEFEPDMPFLLYHDRTMPVGRVKFGKPTPKGIPFTATLPFVKEEGIVKQRVDEAWHSVKYKLITGVSIGFRTLNDAYEILKGGGIKFLKTEVMELSLVVIPANAEATITSVKSLSDLEVASGQAKNKSVSIKTKAGVSANPIVKIESEKPKMSKYLTQIKGFEDAIVEKSARMDEILTKAADEGRSLDAAESEEFDNLESDISASTEHIARLKRMEEANANRAAPVVNKHSTPAGTESRNQNRLPAVAKVKEHLEPGIEFTRLVMCLGAAHGDVGRASKIAEKHYPHTERINIALKAAVEAGTTVDAQWAAPLVEYNQFAGDFVEYLRPQTIIGKFGTNGIPSLRRIPFNVHIRGQTTGGAAYWVGQGAPKPLTSFEFNDVEMKFTKLASISVLTEELLRFSNPSAERLVRDALAGAIIEKMDQTFILPSVAAVNNVSPASITNGVTPIVSSGNDIDSIKLDVQQAMQQFIAARNAPTNGVWIMSATTALALSLVDNALGNRAFPDVNMLGGRFMGLPVIVSEHIVADTEGYFVVLANASDIWLADDGVIRVDASREASLQMDDAPTNNSATGTGSSMVSMYQTNSVAYRAERFINWQKRRASAVAVITGVNWGPEAA